MLRIIGIGDGGLKTGRASFASDERGATMIVFALMLTMLFGILGVCVDYARLVRSGGVLQSAADSAALSAASAALELASQSGLSSQEAVQNIEFEAKKAAQAYFESNAAGDIVKVNTVDVAASIVNGAIEVTVTYVAKMPTSVSGVLGFQTFDIDGVAKAVAKVQPYVDVYLMVDTSGSMAFGASTADQQKLVAATGCQFACHDNAPVNGYADAYDYATKNGVTLRIGALNSGILRLMDEIDAVDPGHRFIRTSVHSFDNQLTNDAPLTSDTSEVRNRLPTTPAISGMTEGATHFKENIDTLVREVGMGGDGSSQDRAIKLFILATDGAQDPGRYWTTDEAARDEVDAFDMSFCSGLKSDNVQVGVIYTPYLPIPGDWGYLETLDQPSRRTAGRKRIDDIEPGLKDCGGDRFVLADDTTTIQSAFAKIFQSLAGIYLAK